MKIFRLIIATLFFGSPFILKAQAPFVWAVASASYQVEGAYQADGKGVSNWDVYTNKYQVTQPLTGKVQTGNTAINAYDREQYMKDIALMKELGVNSYRFSIAWSRILPDGTGKVNEKGILHYKEFIDDLLASGIEPMITLFHWDLPQTLQDKGGWTNPESVKWYEDYAKLVFKSFGNKVKTYITFNEPQADVFLLTPIINNIIQKKQIPFLISSEQWAERATAAHHLLLANATVIRDFHQMKMPGRIGTTLNLSPAIPKNPNNADDVKAATVVDGLFLRWFLDPLFKGKYPADILALFQQYNKTFKPTDADYALFAANKPDFVGVNFYAPQYTEPMKGMPFDVSIYGNNPDPVPMFNGPVRPEYLYKLLMRIKNEYGNPVMLITENGAGFGGQDDTLVNHAVNDSLRTDYIKRHVDTAMQARKDGANLQGYTVWSIFDNFEWIFGYDRRFGIVYVNFDTQERIPKKSFYEYKKIIAANK